MPRIAWDGKPAGCPRLIHMPRWYWRPAFPLFQTWAMSHASSPLQLSMFSAADFPVRTSPSVVRASGSPDSDPACGPTSLDSLANSGHDGLSQRTAPDSDPSVLGLSWTTSARSGMMRSGIVSPLPPLVPLTSVTGSGLWPTPTANRSNQCSLPAALREAARLHPQGRWTLWSQIAALEVYGKRHWPKIAPEATPRSDPMALRYLNPAWVESLMHFPIGWTDCDASETPSSPTSPN